AGALTTRVASTRRSPMPSNSSGMSSTTSLSPRRAARLRKARWRWPTSGWTMASSLRRACLLPNTRAPRAWRSSTPSFTTPGNAASIAGNATPPLAWTAWTLASASYTGTPIWRSIFAAVDLPIPIEPVRPTIIIGERSSGDSCLGLLALARQPAHREGNGDTHRDDADGDDGPVPQPADGDHHRRQDRRAHEADQA